MIINCTTVQFGWEPPAAMSLRCADISLPDLLSVWVFAMQIADRASAIQKAATIQKTDFLKFRKLVEFYCIANLRGSCLHGGGSWQPREGTHGRHEAPLCRHKPPRFAMQTEPPLCSPSLRFADRASAMQ